MRLRDKIAIITGSGGAIGSVTAKRFATEGAKVVVTDVIEEAGEKTVKEIRDSGGDAIFVGADITKVAHTERLVKSVVDRLGRVDVLFNNAGAEVTKSLHEYMEEEYDRVMDVNVKGSFFCTRFVLLEMMKQRGGSIINMGSIGGLTGVPKAGAYSAAKGALVNLTRYVALEYAPYNIRCNCICPGAVDTEMMSRYMQAAPEAARRVIAHHPMGRIARPEEVASAAVFLASDESSFVTGVNLAVDGGYLAGKA